MKLSVQEQVSLLARPEVLQHRVREVESVLRRYFSQQPLPLYPL